MAAASSRSGHQKRADPPWRALPRSAAREIGWELLGAFALTALLLLWAVLARWPTYAIDVGRPGDAVSLTGFYEPQSGDGLDYRWSPEWAQVDLPGVGGGSWLISVRMASPRPQGTPPPVAEVWLDGLPQAKLSLDGLSGFAVYSFGVSVPAARASPTTLGLRTIPFAPADDTRSLGLAVDWVAVTPVPGKGWPAWPIPALFFVLVLSGNALLRGLRLHRCLALVGMVVLAAGVGVLLRLGSAPAFLYLPRLCLLAVLLALATLVASGIEEKRGAGPRGALGRVWPIFVVAVAVRVGIISWPGASIHDLAFQLNFLRIFQSGQWGVTWHPFEFGRQAAYYPLAYYALPASLAALGLPANLALELPTALLDALAVLLVWAIVRRHGANERAALWAAFLYAAVPINLTLLWWGFFSNVFGQFLVLATTLHLTRYYGRLQRPAVFSGGVALVALLGISHIGVAITAAVWLGVTVLLLLSGADHEGRRQALWLAGILLGAGLLVLLYVAPSLPLLWQGAVTTVARPGGRLFADAGSILSLLARGLFTGYQVWPLLLVPLGAVLLARSPSPLPQVLLGSAIAALFFFLLNLATGFQVRYLLFVCPLVCTCAGLALAWAWKRYGWAARAAIVLGCAALLGYSLYYWVLGVCAGVAVSGAALIH